METKDKQRAVIEFLLLEGCVGEEIVAPIRNWYGSTAYCRISISRRISEVRRGNQDLRNEEHPRQILPAQNSYGDSASSTRKPECLTENYCRNSVDFARVHAYVADKLTSEDSTLNFPCTDL
jgi:hypothetical protein